MSTTRFVYDVPENDVMFGVEDVLVTCPENRQEPYNFSDGIGMIGVNVARRLAEALGYYDVAT